MQSALRILIGVLVAMGMVGCDDRGAPRPAAHDGGVADACGAAPAVCAAFADACAALATSTADTVDARWMAVNAPLEQVLAATPTCVRDRYAWLLLHPIEGTLSACGIHDDRVPTIIRAIADAASHGSPRMLGLIRTEEDSICGYAAWFGQARRQQDWSQDSRMSLEGWCAHLLSGFSDTIPRGNGTRGDPSPGGAGASAAVRPPLANAKPVDAHDADAGGGASASAQVCAGMSRLTELRGQMVARTLEHDAWVAYGRALAACGPATSPWTTAAMSQEEYASQYVTPFVGGDESVGGWFQSAAPDAYARIIREWSLD